MRRSQGEVALAVFALIVFASRTSAQMPAAPRAKVGVVHFGVLFSKAEKAQDYKKSLADELQPLKAEAKHISLGLQSAKAVVDDPKTPAEIAAKFREQMAQHHQRLEDIDKTARERIGMVQNEQLTSLYLEFKDAIAAHAKTQDFDIVFAYGELPPDANGFSDVSRKLTFMDVGSSVPIYVRPGADITNDILVQVNNAYRAQKKHAAKAAERAK